MQLRCGGYVGLLTIKFLWLILYFCICSRRNRIHGILWLPGWRVHVWANVLGEVAEALRIGGYGVPLPVGIHVLHRVLLSHQPVVGVRWAANRLLVNQRQVGYCVLSLWNAVLCKFTRKFANFLWEKSKYVFCSRESPRTWLMSDTVWALMWRLSLHPVVQAGQLAGLRPLTTSLMRSRFHRDPWEVSESSIRWLIR